MSDLIDRQEAIDALWKALCEYEDKTEKQFQESDELDISEWILHRIFVQNMSDIDRQTILDAPGIDAVPVVRCKDCKYMTEHYDTYGNAPYWTCSEWDSGTDYDGFCHYAERRTDGTD